MCLLPLLLLLLQVSSQVATATAALQQVAMQDHQQATGSPLV
jgi:hypothetical protein